MKSSAEASGGGPSTAVSPGPFCDQSVAWNPWLDDGESGSWAEWLLEELGMRDPGRSDGH